jgi:CheY-like chemotaxis protein
MTTLADETTATDARVAASAPMSTDAAGRFEEWRGSARRATRHGKILVIDDEPMVLSAVGRLLGREHSVTTLSSAEEALVALGAGERFDVILCDLMMPEMTGMDFFDELARSIPDQAERTIFLTGGASTRRARSFLDSTPNPRIEKPFEPHHLCLLVNDLLVEKERR